MNPEKKVKLMDSGTTRFQVEGDLSDALNKVMTEMARDGGRVTRVSDSEAVLDHSGLFRHRFITAKVEASGDGYAVSFKEGNSLTRTSRILLWTLAILLVASIIACFSGWWRLPCCLGISLLLLYGLTAPEDACRRRMERILQQFGQ